MKHDDGALLSVFLHFIAISFLTMGGVISALPEMHRFAVDLEGWLTDRQFAEMFAIAQITPGPNMMIVTLIGYQAAGVLGGVVATACVSVPPAVLSYFVARGFERANEAAWPRLFRAGLMPVSVGLVLATSLVIAMAANESWQAWVLMGLSTAVMMSTTRVHPLWLLAVGGTAGFFGLL